MSAGYRAVQWNRDKLVYDGILIAVVAFYILGYVAIATSIHPPKDFSEAIDLRIRATGTCAFLMLTVILSIGPLACILLALRQGAPTEPGRAGAVAGLVSGGIAAALYASHCTDDSPLFVATWYSLAIGVVVLAGYIAGSRLLRW